MQQIFPQKLNSFQILISLFFFLSTFALATRNRARSDGNLEMHLKSEQRGARSSDPVVLRWKNFKTTKNSPKRPDHFFLAQSIIFQILFSFFVKFNYSNMVNPANFMIQRHQRWFAKIEGEFDKKKMEAVIEQFLKALPCDWIWIFIRKNLLLLHKFFLKLPFKHIFWHGIPKYFVFLLRTHVFRSITINAQQRECYNIRYNSRYFI